MPDSVVWTNAHNVRIEVPLASIGMRIVAYIIDMILISSYLYFVLSTLGKLGIDSTIRQVSDTIVVLLFIVILSPAIFYSLIFELFNDGQSIGKMVCNLKVTSQTGKSPSSESFLLRWIFRLIDLKLIGQFIGLMSALLSSKRQRIGDMVADTVVVNTNVIRRALHETYTKLPERYTPVYEEAKRLNREDISIIKEIFKMELGPARDALIIKMNRKISETYNIQSDAPPKRLLSTLVRDYNYFKLNEG